MALNINGRMKVKTLKADFKKEFGLNIRLYDGREFADDDATLASIRKGDSTGGEFAPQRNTKVGNLEDKIMDLFGLKTQVSGSDDSYLCENDHTLAKALEVDEKLMSKRANRETKADTEDVQVNDDKNEEEQMSIEEIIDMAKRTYSDHEDLEQMVADLTEGKKYIYWAGRLCTKRYEKNLKLVKALFETAVNESDSYDLALIAEYAVDPDLFNDEAWAKELFVGAFEISKDDNDKEYIFEIIGSSLDDKVWLSEMETRFGVSSNSSDEPSKDQDTEDDDKFNWGDDDDNDDEKENTHTIYLKSEPSGEFILGKLPEEEVELLKKLHGTDKYKASYLINDLGYYNYDDLGHANGILSDCSKGDFTEDDDADIEFDEIAEISTSYEDGFYIYSTHLSKMSLEITFDLPDDEPFNPNKLKVKYVNLDMDEFETSRYGELYGSIYSGYFYDGEEIGDDEEMVDRGIESDIFIFQVKDEELQCIYHRDADDNETWEKFLD